MSVIRKWLCLLLSLVLVLMSVNALAESAVADGKAVEYLYSFTPGNILEGEGTEMIHELLEAIRLRFYRQKTADKDMICLVLVSNDEDAFVLTAGETGGEEFALTCSLLGSNKLTLKKDQIPSFLQTLVKALGDKEILKGANLDKMNSLANRVGEIILDYLNKEPTEAPEMGIDLTPYLEIMTREATATEVREIPPEERDGSGAVTVTSYLVSQEQRKNIVNRAMDKLDRLPVIGDELRKGSLRIGQQVITDDFIRTVFADTPGEVTMDVWQDESGQLVRLLLHVPDISGIVTDPQFSKVQGIEISIDRTKGEGKKLTSITTITLPGIDGKLLTMTLERDTGADIPPMKADNVHAVGQLNSDELMELILSMGWTILFNAANMVLSLPDCIALTLYNRIVK
jgi:hypothetical protein